ncbi:Cytochrome P450 [Macleaya cordata]|uniref:Cytochrome P450 n=1 Tax=Macleaya cordata TaxID=56857 RepID=A0A200Q069_MACCD|nr:Cytochrome P450 [Macleaya cordata]
MEFPSWFIYAAAWFAAVALLLKGFYLRRPKLNLPPRPKSWPIIGNLNLIGSLPHRSIHHLSQKHGPLMQLKFGSYPVVVASSVDMAKQFLKTHDITFSGRPKTAAGKYTTYNYSDITWSQYGPYWRQARKMCIMELFSSKRLESYEYIRIEETQALLNVLYASRGTTINLKDHLSDVSLNVISRIVLGKKYLDQDSSRASIVTPDEFKEMLDELFLLNGVLNIGDSIPWLGFLDLQGYVKRMKVLSKKFDRFLEHVVDEHNARREGAGEDFVAKDMVDVLLQLADDPNLDVKLTKTSVKAFTQDMIAGGTESSAVTVEWAISELLKHPEIFEKATEELDRIIGRERWVEEKDIPNLPYIEAIVKETMRMHPVAPLLVPRQTREDIKINGYDILAGTRAFVNVWTIGRDPTLWEEPEQFRPERFIGKAIDVKGHDFELLPFGAGRRMCPGYTLGLKVIQSSLANLLHGFVWKLPEKMKVEDLNMEEIWGLSTPRKIPLVAVVEPRIYLRRPKLNLPPGPKPCPIIGNLNLMGSLPHCSIHDLSQKYGPLMQLLFGSYPVVVASSVDMAKQFLKTHDIIFSGRPKTAAGKYTTYNYSDITWSQYGPYWRQLRKICIIELFSSKRLESYEYIRIEETRAVLKTLYDSRGTTINLKYHLSDLSLNIISRIVLGKKYLRKFDQDSNSRSIFTSDEFKHMLDELFLLNGVLNIGDLIPWLGFLDLQGYVKRMKVLSKKFDKFLEHVLDEHNGKRERAGEDFVAKDMVDVLLQLSDDPNLDVKLTRTSVKAFTQDMMAGGTESSAATVEWAMSELLKHPEIFEKATEELDRVIGRERSVEEKDIQNLPYIEAIVKETMRMHPVSPILAPRQTREDCKINGYDIPAGTRALVSTWTIGRDSTVWEEPEQFRPERFIGKAIDVKGHDFELLPFGAGRRMYMAKQFLTTHDIAFSGRPKTAAGKYTTYNYSNITWSQYGPYWRQARKICIMELFSSKRLESYEYIRIEETRALIKALYASRGRPINLKDHLSDVTLNVLSRIVLGKKYLDESEYSFVTPRDFKEMLDELFLLNGVLNIGDSIPWLGFLDLQGYVKRMKVLGKKFDRFMEQVLDEHNDRRYGAGKDFVAKDMVDVLLQLSDDPNLDVKLTRTSVKAFTQENINHHSDIFIWLHKNFDFPIPMGLNKKGLNYPSTILSLYSSTSLNLEERSFIVVKIMLCWYSYIRAYMEIFRGSV